MTDASCIIDAERPCPTHDAAVGCTYCCADNDTCGLNFGNCSGHSWNCRSNANCGGGLCCLGITVTSSSSCPEQVTAGNTVCSDAGSSCGTAKSLCITNAECDGGTCKPVLVAGMSTPIGVCM